MTRRLRLLVTPYCNRNCVGCCNKDWQLDKLPRVESFGAFDEIILTGGEPLLYPTLTLGIIEMIRRVTNAPIYVYTAESRLPFVLPVLSRVDGLTLTLHEPADVVGFQLLNIALLDYYTGLRKSLRLNVFEGVDLTGTDLKLWKVKTGIRWIPNCPLPEGEVFMRM